MFLILLFASFFTPPTDASDPEKGVSQTLALQRAAIIYDVSYALHFDLPKARTSDIDASANITFKLRSRQQDIVLDFNAPPEYINAIKVNRKEVAVQLKNGHLVIPKKYLKKGKNNAFITFTAGNDALNRSPDFMYTLFVPNRAATAFPCFDQPDIKASFQLTLSVPAEWVAVSNAQLKERKCQEKKCTYTFFPTQPISTYLFSFVAGVFQQEVRILNGREMVMYHRETDSLKVARNTDEIFRLHASSLTWLEEYTQIDMPFTKFDFVLIPSFQFGGMEHVGAILYKSSSLFLEESATQNQKLQRASLIAHETSHMWFGNLVTMKWFNDVWLKEVFANFIASKIVNPNFPDINHTLRFLLTHHPSAYSEDRTAGSHPIQQKLENLQDAGTLYGRIIYQKAPIVMQQLELLMGESAFREGVRDYLQQFSFDNAVWDDLISILDSKTAIDLATWSNVWVKEPSMPKIAIHIDEEDGMIKQMRVRQDRKSQQGNYWPQRVEAILVHADSSIKIPVQLNGEVTQVPQATGLPIPDFSLVDGSGLGYGFFSLDTKSQQFLLKHISAIEQPVVRGAAWMALYEEMLHGNLKPTAFMQTIMHALPIEYEPLNTQNILGYLKNVFWKFYTPRQRQAISHQLEEELWRVMYHSVGQSAKAAYFRTYRHIAYSPEAIESLKNIWEGKLKIDGLTLSERDMTSIACELAVRGIEGSDQLLATQIERIQNPDLRRRITFIKPALSKQESIRDQFFLSLKDVNNRNYEPWVLEALSYLHHPLRSVTSEKYIRPSLELLKEIQETGDIFFPKRWLLATFKGHQTASAAKEVQNFLAAHPAYPYRLKNKILQAADPLFRAAAIQQLE